MLLKFNHTISRWHIKLRYLFLVPVSIRAKYFNPRKFFKATGLYLLKFLKLVAVSVLIYFTLVLLLSLRNIFNSNMLSLPGDESGFVQKDHNKSKVHSILNSFE